MGTTVDVGEGVIVGGTTVDVGEGVIVGGTAIGIGEEVVVGVGERVIVDETVPVPDVSSAILGVLGTVVRVGVAEGTVVCVGEAAVANLVGEESGVVTKGTSIVKSIVRLPPSADSMAIL